MFQIRPAEKRQAKLRLALIGVSGSGKSLGAINIAAGMGKKFVVIDTERKSADLYADVTKFDVLSLDKPFSPEKYIQAILHCEKLGYEIIIIDSLSHAWAGEGGMLDMQDIATQASTSKNSYLAWKQITPWHNKLVDTILQVNCHIIATMRVKTHYEVVSENGKVKPIKIGLSPIQREGMDYEFTTVLDLDKDSHIYSSSKDRTQLFEGKHEKLTQETGKKLMAWLDNGKPIDQIEIEEIERLKSEITMAMTIDKLKSELKTVRDKYPSHLDEFTKLASQRRKEIERNDDIEKDIAI